MPAPSSRPDHWSQVRSRMVGDESAENPLGSPSLKHLVSASLIQIHDLDGEGHYRALELQRNASQEDIKKVTDKLALILGSPYQCDETKCIASLSLTYCLLVSIGLRPTESALAGITLTKVATPKILRGYKLRSRRCRIPSGVQCMMSGLRRSNSGTCLACPER